MTRRKKSRQPGPLAPSKKPREELQRDSQTKAKRNKGHKPGSRHNLTRAKNEANSVKPEEKDSRFGSKKPVTLIAPQALVSEVADKPQPTAQQELEALQNDTKLQRLIALLEAGEELSESDLSYLDSRTERFNQLAEELGLELDDDDDELGDWEDEDDY